jgi:hypothetical protein
MQTSRRCRSSDRSVVEAQRVIENPHPVSARLALASSQEACNRPPGTVGDREQSRAGQAATAQQSAQPRMSPTACVAGVVDDAAVSPSCAVVRRVNAGSSNTRLRCNPLNVSQATQQPSRTLPVAAEHGSQRLMCHKATLDEGREERSLPPSHRSGARRQLKLRSRRD